jgi:hypothetical protein
VPGCSWAERAGSFINHEGKVQTFEAGIAPLEGCQRDGNYLYQLAFAGVEPPARETLAGRGPTPGGGPGPAAGLYQAAKVRGQMAAEMPEFAGPHLPPPLPAHAH